MNFLSLTHKATLCHLPGPRFLCTHDVHESSSLQQSSPFPRAHSRVKIWCAVITSHTNVTRSTTLCHSPNFFCQNLYSSTFAKHYRRQIFPLYGICTYVIYVWYCLKATLQTKEKLCSSYVKTCT